MLALRSEGPGLGIDHLTVDSQDESALGALEQLKVRKAEE